MNNQTQAQTQNQTPAAYMAALVAFRTAHHRNPLPRVYFKDRAFWETLEAAEGTSFVDQFEAWVMS